MKLAAYSLNDAIRGEMVTVFIPSSPTAIAGYVVVAHRERVVDLPLTVEEALRLLISGGVLVPQAPGSAPIKVDPLGSVTGPAETLDPAGAQDDASPATGKSLEQTNAA